jgi:DNA-binding SARP family transcriptional activator
MSPSPTSDLQGAVHSAAPSSRVEVHLLGGVRMCVDGRDVTLSTTVARLVAFIALSAPYAVDRTQLAGTLWPDHSDTRAGANLRSVLWRSRSSAHPCLDVPGSAVGLAPAVWLDIWHPDEVIDLHTSRRAGGAIPELLPGWYDDWVVHERERIRQLMLHALEDASRASIDADDCRAAIDLALHAVAMEPLRETPHRLVAEAHLAEGNRAEAIRSFVSYAALLQSELAISPSERFGNLVSVNRASIAR